MEDALGRRLGGGQAAVARVVAGALPVELVVAEVVALYACDGARCLADVCAAGGVPDVRWLMSQFEFADVREAVTAAYREARGNPAVARWLLETYPCLASLASYTVLQTGVHIAQYHVVFAATDADLWQVWVAVPGDAQPVAAVLIQPSSIRAHFTECLGSRVFNAAAGDTVALRAARSNGDLARAGAGADTARSISDLAQAGAGADVASVSLSVLRLSGRRAFRGFERRGRG